MAGYKEQPSRPAPRQSPPALGVTTHRWEHAARGELPPAPVGEEDAGRGGGAAYSPPRWVRMRSRGGSTPWGAMTSMLRCGCDRVSTTVRAL